MATIERFTRAQDAVQGGFDDALAEVRAGQKQGHWIWYVFPQLRGLGSSPTAREFGIQGREEAEAYLRDEVLRGRLLQAMAAIEEQLSPPHSRPLAALMGSHLDARKLVSSLTLFEAVAADVHQSQHAVAVADVANQAGAVLDLAATQGFTRCRFTLDTLEMPKA
jgi:uncharacterized protein (DUF1810 family)